MNKVIMMGRMVVDAELKTTPNSIAACNFRIAVDRNYQKKGEDKKVDFFNCVAWRGTAEFISKWFPKGRLILIEGEMQTKQYIDKNGNAAIWYEIQVDNAYFTGEKSADAQSAPAPMTATPTYGTSQTPPNNYAAGAVANDDYPF